MADQDFLIPISKEDLTVDDTPGQYVAEVLPIRQLPYKVRELEKDVKSKDALLILGHFDTVYSLLCHFRSAGQEVKNSVWDLMLKVLEEQCQVLPTVLVDHASDKRICKQHLNSLKMICYLVCQLMQSFQAEASQPSTVPKKKGKPQKKADRKNDWDWDGERDHAVLVLCQLVKLNLAKLWDPPVMEDDFVSLITSTCYKLLENADIVHQRNKETRITIFHIMAIMAKKYNNDLSASLKIIQMLQHFEHLGVPLAHAVEIFVKEYGLKDTVNEIMREIGRMDPKELARDNSATRSYAVFMVELAGRVPDAVLPCISVLLCHLDEESYSMRNAVLGVMGELLLHMLTAEQQDNKLKSTRDQFLDRLEDHIHDVNAFVRSKVLQIWLRICNENAIPLPRQHELLKLVSGRLEDKSSNVRKAAIQLLGAYLKCNPFAAKLSLGELEERLKKETNKLKEILPETDAEENKEGNQLLSEAKERWNAMEERVLEAAAQVLTCNDSMEQELPQDAQFAIADDDSEDTVIGRICSLLNEEKFEEAVKLLQAAADAFPGSPRLQRARNTDSQSDEASLDVSQQQADMENYAAVLSNLFIESLVPSLVEEAVEQRKETQLEGDNQPVVNEVTKQQVLVQYLQIVDFVKNGEIENSVIQMLWERFAMKIPGTTQDESKAALKLLAMAAGAVVEIVKSNIDILIEEGFGKRAENDFELATDACVALMKMAGGQKVKAGSLAPPCRFDAEHEMFSRLSNLLVKGITNLSDRHYIPLAQQGVSLIYKLAEHPDRLCGAILKQVMEEIVCRDETDNDSNDDVGSSGVLSEATRINPSHLCRLIVVVGQVALKQLVHVDSAVTSELKRRRAIQEEVNSKKKQPHRRKSSLPGDGSKTKESTGDMIEDEMGLTGAVTDDVEADYVRKVCDKEIVTGDNLLAQFAPLVVAICTNPGEYAHEELQTAAALSLAQFMIVSSEFCEEHLQLLFTILEKSTHPTIRGNTIVAIGDLTFRFPNLIEPWTTHLYARLRDESSQVRRNTVMVLTHLILNDMVKVKGQLSELTLCLSDVDERVASLTKLFFHELSKKGNAVYNILPDVISRLSDPDAGVPEEQFRNIMSYLFSFIQKDKQLEGLVEKLCHRFRATRSDRQWHDLAYCLSLLSYGERSIRKLLENFSCFADKLADDDVYACLSSIVDATRKYAKVELKNVLDELADRLHECHVKGLDEGQVADKAAKHSQAAPKSQKKRGSKRAPARTPLRNKWSSDEEDGDFAPRSTRPVRQRKPVRAVTFSSDEENDDDVFPGSQEAYYLCVIVADSSTRFELMV
ncbi:PREDICTED: condensin complex subunit 1-like [Priapulus caudatus]|uniref:Condensin complex subunit 1 n=1 Tax=Priapulus caudatus TaxID=37621 RepID=A0ABM1EG88_PRICU|nr:PREDICTED: condensin complex subunit 1-like [Priapulus caudatus]